MKVGTIAPDSVGFILLLAGLMSMPAMTIDINLPAVPETAVALGTTLTAAQWTVPSFFLGFAIGQAFYGSFSDRYGRKPLLMLGIAIYLVGTVGCAVAPSIEFLLAMRVLQGIGGGAGPVLGRAIVRDLFEGPAMARVMSFTMAVFILAPIIAPSIGALILEFAPWQAIFVFLGIYGLVVMAAAQFLLAETLKEPDPQATSPTRMLGAYRTVLTTRTSLMFGGIALFALSGLVTYLSTSPAIFMDAFALSAREYGFVFAAIAACVSIGSLLNTRLIKRWSLETVIRGAAFLGLMSTLVGLGLTLIGVLDLLTTMPFFAGFFFAFSLIVPNAMSLAMRPFSRMAGAASAALGVLQAVIPAIIGGLVAWAYDGTAAPTFFAMALLCLCCLVVHGLYNRGHAVPEAESSS
ncbi:MAG: multidrug effflux MFS transporter [Pseudomonadota bacterium]